MRFLLKEQASGGSWLSAVTGLLHDAPGPSPATSAGVLLHRAVPAAWPSSPGTESVPGWVWQASTLSWWPAPCHLAALGRFPWSNKRPRRFFPRVASRVPMHLLLPARDSSPRRKGRPGRTPISTQGSDPGLVFGLGPFPSPLGSGFPREEAGRTGSSVTEGPFQVVLNVARMGHSRAQGGLVGTCSGTC